LSPDDRHYDDGPRRPRAKSANYYPPSPPRSRSRHRDRSRSRDDRDRKDKGKDFHIGASLAGALAGGYLGHEAGRGDRMSTIAGVVVGALGASLLEHQVDKRKERKGDRKERRDKYDY
jgi:uncharacterized protein YcfJ